MSIPKESSASRIQDNPKIIERVLFQVPEHLPVNSQQHESIDTFVNGTIHRGLYLVVDKSTNQITMHNCLLNNFDNSDLQKKVIVNVEIQKLTYGNNVHLCTITITKNPKASEPLYQLNIKDSETDNNPDIIIGNKSICFQKLN